MAKIEQFEDLTVWQEGLKLSIEVYKSLAACQDFGLRDQMRRCSVSIPPNIAEGFERNSNGEFIRFLRNSKGSAGELRTQLYLAIGVGMLDEQVGQELTTQSRIISKRLQALVKVRLEKF